MGANLDRLSARDPAAMSVPPLGLIVVCFFLPFASMCDKVERPVKVVAENPAGFWFLVPWFAAAGVLAAATLASLACGREPGARRALVGLYAVAACLTGTL